LFCEIAVTVNCQFVSAVACERNYSRPDLIRLIAEKNSEILCHSGSPRKVCTSTPPHQI